MIGRRRWLGVQSQLGVDGAVLQPERPGGALGGPRGLGQDRRGSRGRNQRQGLFEVGPSGVSGLSKIVVTVRSSVSNPSTLSSHPGTYAWTSSGSSPPAVRRRLGPAGSEPSRRPPLLVVGLQHPLAGAQRHRLDHTGEPHLSRRLLERRSRRQRAGSEMPAGPRQRPPTGRRWGRSCRPRPAPPRPRLGRLHVGRHRRRQDQHRGVHGHDRVDQATSGQEPIDASFPGRPRIHPDNETVVQRQGPVAADHQSSPSRPAATRKSVAR